MRSWPSSAPARRDNGHDHAMSNLQWAGGRDGWDRELAEVMSRELQLLRPDVRRDPEAVSGLLHEEFREFGASGRVWDRPGTLASLAAEGGGPAVEAEHMEAARLADDVVLLTYRAHRPGGRVSLRSSVWVRGRAGWQLLFHQGTACP